MLLLNIGSIQIKSVHTITKLRTVATHVIFNLRQPSTHNVYVRLWSDLWVLYTTFHVSSSNGSLVTAIKKNVNKFARPPCFHFKFLVFLRSIALYNFRIRSGNIVRPSQKISSVSPLNTTYCKTLRVWRSDLPQTYHTHSTFQRFDQPCQKLKRETNRHTNTSLIGQCFLLCRKQSRLKVHGSSKDLTKKEQYRSMRWENRALQNATAIARTTFCELNTAAQLHSCRNIPFRQSLTCPQPWYINSHIEMLFFCNFRDNIQTVDGHNSFVLSVPLSSRHIILRDSTLYETVSTAMIYLLIDILFLTADTEITH